MEQPVDSIRDISAAYGLVQIRAPEVCGNQVEGFITLQCLLTLGDSGVAQSMICNPMAVYLGNMN